MKKILIAMGVLIMSAVPTFAQQKLFTATEKSKATTEKVSAVKSAGTPVCNRQTCPEQQPCNACPANCAPANCKNCAGCTNSQKCAAANCKECPNAANCCKNAANCKECPKDANCCKDAANCKECPKDANCCKDAANCCRNVDAAATNCNQQRHCGNGPMKFIPKKREINKNAVNAKAEKKNQLGEKEVVNAQAVKKVEKK